MSFTSNVKEELTHVAPGCSHCDRAVLAALVRAEGTLLFSGQGRYRLEVTTDAPCVARLATRLLHEVYSLKTALTVRRSVLHKTPNYLIEVSTQPGLTDALVDMGVLSEQGGLELGIADQLVSKPCCAAAYLRGAFLGSGFVSDPSGDFHFEISAENEDQADDLVELFAESGIKARIMQRRNAFIVYLKSGSSISAFLALSGAHNAALQLENERILKGFRNDVNRLTNAEVANQGKAVAASMDQLIAIKKVVDGYGFENLPPALQEFILLRVANRELSLKELGELATPPLSKSAVYHRVRRIEQMARDLSK